MTYSIVARDSASGDLGVAVQSKFPNAGVTIPFARAGVGALATQAYCNTAFGPRGLALLEQGASAAQALEILVQGDPDRDFRQLGLVDAAGRAAAFTGGRCFDWCGSVQGEGFTAQGNVLAGPEVVQAMADCFSASTGPLTERLLSALAAGQAAGGERRGQQSAGLLVVRAGGGYGGFDDRLAAISVYDHPSPIAELQRLYQLHRLTYLAPDPADLRPIAGDLAHELRALLSARGFPPGAGGDAFDARDRSALHDFMGWENYDARIRDDGRIDGEVLADIRARHRDWQAAGGH
jgi:uncharacterized Ntn-hydrolase superfamily protein